MANNYSVSTAQYLGNTSNPMVTVGVFGTVNGTSVFVTAFASALDQAFAASGLAGLQNYLGPLMLAAFQNIFGPTTANPDVRSSMSPSGSATSYPNAPGTWSA